MHSCVTWLILLSLWSNIEEDHDVFGHNFIRCEFQSHLFFKGVLMVSSLAILWQNGQKLYQSRETESQERSGNEMPLTNFSYVTSWTCKRQVAVHETVCSKTSSSCSAWPSCLISLPSFLFGKFIHMHYAVLAWHLSPLIFAGPALWDSNPYKLSKI